MKKFIVHTRAIPGTCRTVEVPTIVEVEGEVITALQDPSSIFLPVGEFRFRIMKPEFLFEPEGTSKEKKMVPAIYHSHAIFSTAEEARVVSKKMIVSDFEFTKRKQGIDFTEAEIEEKLALVETLSL